MVIDPLSLDTAKRPPQRDWDGASGAPGEALKAETRLDTAKHQVKPSRQKPETGLDTAKPLRRLGRSLALPKARTDGVL
jgi:hypothetical protein